jgi:hypothetical protein
MALIWAKGFSGDRALAPAWLALEQAKATRAEAETVLLAQTSPAHAQSFAAATIALKDAQTRYDALVAAATESLEKEPQALTHFLVVGVGKYDTYPNIPSVTTSLNGARKFAEWVLTTFTKEDRPLGSVEFICSTAKGQVEWAPSDAARATLGLAAPVAAFTTESATFINIKDAFERWLARAGTNLDNAAIFYFAGHGVFKSETIIMAQDSRLPTDALPAVNLIAPYQTMFRLQSRKPRVQCFFIDACSEYNTELTNNPQETPAEALCGANNAPAIQNRDATLYYGSYAGGKAYGPGDDAPYFTQELIECLTKRAGDGQYGGSLVTLSSLSQALKAAAYYRAEFEKNSAIAFSESKPGVVGGSGGDLCDLVGPRQIMVQVRCSPQTALSRAKLYIMEASGKRVDRVRPLADYWYTIVEPGKWTAKAELDNTTYVCLNNPFEPRPPVFNAVIKIEAVLVAAQPKTGTSA